ncbi:MAG: hypothetical protein IJS13_07670 [Paludibacteraceae bacterium]|nr:hypothetical protein [Paludibacteraceae bacterium]
MRKTILFVMTLLTAVALYAEEGEQNLGFNLGFSDVILRERSSAATTKLDSKSPLYGIKAGIVYQNTMIAGFGVQLGLNYTFGTHLGKPQPVDGNISTLLEKKTDWYYHQLEIPIDWQYQFEIAKETYLIIYTGPTLNVGLSLKRIDLEDKLKGNFYTGELITDRKEYQLYDKNYDADGDGNRDYFRTNVMWGVGAGFRYKRYFLRGGYDFGITNPYRDRYFDISTGNQWRRKGRFDQWSIKLGIYLWQF